ncbi:hypothetical protein CTH30272_03082 [Allocatenococcus thiocycli]|nr:hypothetical protein CTH30272_03082 [Catenococcus thiocycli]
MKIDRDFKEKYPESVRNKLKDLFRKPEGRDLLMKRYGNNGFEELKTFLKEILTEELGAKQREIAEMSSKASELLNNKQTMDALELLETIADSKRVEDDYKTILKDSGIELDEAEVVKAANRNPNADFVERLTNAIAKNAGERATVEPETKVEQSVEGVSPDADKKKPAHKVGFKM